MRGEEKGINKAARPFIWLWVGGFLGGVGRRGGGGGWVAVTVEGRGGRRKGAGGGGRGVGSAAL